MAQNSILWVLLTLLDTRKGECITGFYLRSGFWVDGLAIITSMGRKSAVYGNANGGSGYVRKHLEECTANSAADIH